MSTTVAPDSPAGTEQPEPPTGQRRGWSARWKLVACLVVVLGALAWIAVQGLGGSFVYYLTPTDIAVDHQASVGQRVRLGGYVVDDTVRRAGDTLTFQVSDGAKTMAVVSTGPVPQMFRDGQGVVLEGALGADGRFHSDTVLIKHNGEYRPPESGQDAP